jgi:hypothetical protein
MLRRWTRSQIEALHRAVQQSTSGPYALSAYELSVQMRGGGGGDAAGDPTAVGSAKAARERERERDKLKSPIEVFHALQRLRKAGALPGGASASDPFAAAAPDPSSAAPPLAALQRAAEGDSRAAQRRRVLLAHPLNPSAGAVAGAVTGDKRPAASAMAPASPPSASAEPQSDDDSGTPQRPALKRPRTSAPVRFTPPPSVPRSRATGRRHTKRATPSAPAATATAATAAAATAAAVTVPVVATSAAASAVAGAVGGTAAEVAAQGAALWAAMRSFGVAFLRSADLDAVSGRDYFSALRNAFGADTVRALRTPLGALLDAEVANLLALRTASASASAAASVSAVAAP